MKRLPTDLIVNSKAVTVTVVVAITSVVMVTETQRVVKFEVLDLKHFQIILLE